MTAFGLVPARGGSKGIPRKNVRRFLGRPLVAWAVEAGLASGVLDRVVVSTDDDEIAEAARGAGGEVVARPSELARDDTPTAAVVRHALDLLAPAAAHVIVLEPTSPGRRPQHVRAALDLLGAGADSVATVSPVPHHFVAPKQLVLAADGTIAGLDGTPVARMTHRRQDLDVTYAFDGIVFGSRAELVLRDPPTLWGERVAAVVVDPLYAVDLDREEDWAPAEERLRSVLV